MASNTGYFNTAGGDDSVPYPTAVRVLPCLPTTRTSDYEEVVVMNYDQYGNMVSSSEPNNNPNTDDIGADGDSLSLSDLPPPPPELLHSDNDYLDDDDDDDGLYADTVVITQEPAAEYNKLHEISHLAGTKQASGRYSALIRPELTDTDIPEEHYSVPERGEGNLDISYEASAPEYDILVPEWEDSENIYDTADQNSGVYTDTVVPTVDDGDDAIYAGVAEFTTDRTHSGGVCNPDYMSGLEAQQQSDSESDDYSGWPTDEFDDDEDDGDGGFQTEEKKSFFQGVQNVLNPPYHVLPSPEATTNEECAYIDVNICGTRHPPPRLPPEPPGLTQLQKLRRAIVQQIIDTENSYIRTLQRLRYMYSKPLLEQNPPIISHRTVNMVFANIPEILQCHTMVQIALAARVSDWDSHDSIGDVFVASFSKSMVYDVYSKFVMNFTYAMQTIRKASLAKTSFKQFLKGRESLTADRLSIFCLMVKPIQRFPQLIMLVQDLLRNTPKHHTDRTHLQLALTELESLAEKLNQVMQDSEDTHEVRDIVRCLNVNFSDSFVKPNRYLIRQDDVIQMDFAEQEEKRKKSRRLILMNDLLLCVSVSHKSMPVDKKTLQAVRNRALKFDLKFCVPINDVNIINEELDISKSSKSKSHENINTKSDVVAGNLKRLYDEREDLLHDYNIIGQVMGMVGLFKNSYQDVNMHAVNNCATKIKQMTRAKQHQIRTAVGCTLTISVPGKSSKIRYTFNVDSRDAKVKWQSDMELAKLKLDTTTTPSWKSEEDGESNKGHQALPLFVTSGEIQVTRQTLRMMCAIQSPLSCSPSACDDLDTSVLYGSCQGYLWLCCSEPRMGQISIVSFHSTVPRVVECFTACESPVLVIEVVPGLEAASDGYSRPPLDLNCTTGKKNEVLIKEPSVWIGTEWGRVIAYSCGHSSKRVKLLTLTTCRPVKALKYLNNRLFVGLKDGSLLIYRRATGGVWKTKEPRTSQLGQTQISSLLAVDKTMWCACRNKIHIVSAETEMVEVCFEAHLNSNACVNVMVRSGVGVWIAFTGHSIIRLYHTETRGFLQEIDISSPIRRMKPSNFKSKTVSCEITCMLITNGRLWVGCADGVIVTLRLPKLGGLPLISSPGLVSLHSHRGPVRFLTAVSASNMWVKSESCEDLADNRDDMQTPEVELNPKRPWSEKAWPSDGNITGENPTYDDVAKSMCDDIVSSIYDNVSADSVEPSPETSLTRTDTMLRPKKFNFSPSVLAEMRQALTKELGQEFFKRKSSVSYASAATEDSSTQEKNNVPEYLDLVPDDGAAASSLGERAKAVTPPDNDSSIYEDVSDYTPSSRGNVEQVQTILPNLSAIKKKINVRKQSTLVVSGGEGYAYLQSNDTSKNKSSPTLFVWHCQ